MVDDSVEIELDDEWEWRDDFVVNEFCFKFQVVMQISGKLLVNDNIKVMNK